MWLVSKFYIIMLLIEVAILARKLLNTTTYSLRHFRLCGNDDYFIFNAKS